MKYLSNLSILILLGLIRLARAQESTGPQAPAIKPQDELTLTPKYLAEAAPANDLWNDYGDRWRFRLNITPWTAGIHGSVGKGDFQTTVDSSFSDVFDKANAGAGLNMEVGKGPISVVVNGLYLHMESDAATRRGFDADMKGQFGLVDIALAYQLLNIPVGTESRFYFDAMPGFRWTYLSAEIDINEGPLAGRDQNRERNFFDPYIGARARFDINRNMNVSVLANYGAFGGGSNSTWGAYAQFEYRFDSKWSLILGYRALNYNYANNGFKFDATLQGPMIGLGFRM